MPGTILLVGCGKMGGALLGRWLEGGAANRVTVIEPNASLVPEDRRVTVLPGPEALEPTDAPDALVLAVKPQVMPTVAPAYRGVVDRGAVALSIAAGLPLRFFADIYGAEAACVRAMPNTPAAIGRGMTVLVAAPHVGQTQRTRCERLMAVGGDVAWLDDEALIDAATAVSGSGPAYVFLLIEVLADAGRQAGLPADLAMRLARQTVIGSASLADASGEAAAALRKAVTSPGGTTEAALAELMGDDGLARVFERAVAANMRRSRELGS